MCVWILTCVHTFSFFVDIEFRQVFVYLNYATSCTEFYWEMPGLKPMDMGHCVFPNVDSILWSLIIFLGEKNPDIAWCNRNPGCIPKVITILILSPSNPQYCWWYYDIFWYILINVISRGVTIISTIMLGVDVGSMPLFRIENLTPVSLGMSSVCTSLMSSSSPSSPLAYFLKASGDSIQASGAFRSCSVRHMFCQNVKIGEQWWLNYSN